jgi:hypothetical protein
MSLKKENAAPAKVAQIDGPSRKLRTEGLWLKCEGCRQIIWKKDLESNWNVCPKCGAHMRMGAAVRLKLLFDGDYERFDTELRSSDALDFFDSKPYRERLDGMRLATSLSDAMISAEGTVAGRHVSICSMEARFIGGSMGCVVGEMITRAIERSIARRIPLAIVSASGGAHAGRRGEPDADGQDFGRADASGRIQPPLYRRADGSDYRRRHGQFRDAGRGGAAAGDEELHRHGAAILHGLGGGQACTWTGQEACPT